MPLSIPNQLFNDLHKDLQVALRMDGEFFSLKYSRRDYFVHNRDTVEINIYAEPLSRYESFQAAVSMPFKIKLNPEAKELNKWGFQSKRDAVIVFSRYLLENVFNILPKEGDRFDWNGRQYEIKELRATDEWRDSGYCMHYVGGCSLTTKAPNPLPDLVI